MGERAPSAGIDPAPAVVRRSVCRRELSYYDHKRPRLRLGKRNGAKVFRRLFTGESARMKWARILYWVVAIPFAGLMLFAAFNYVFKHDLIVDVFHRLGYPTYIIYPLAVAKILGVTAILTRRSAALKEWAYAGFFFNFVLALSAHISVGDNQFAPALICLVLLVILYILDKKIYGAR